MKNELTLIIPDIHLQYKRAENIIKHVSPDKTVFLGDYFDDFGDDYRDNLITAEWLKNSLKDPSRIHLFGNHDVSYAFGDKRYFCSGYETGKDYAINSVMTPEDWKKLLLYTKVGDYYCSHAGLQEAIFKNNANGRDVDTFLQEECNKALDIAFANKDPHYLLGAGKSRGGFLRYGGIIWCDANEFRPIRGIKQIFGHTPQKTPRFVFADNLALDCRHASYYAVHKNDILEIKSILDL